MIFEPEVFHDERGYFLESFKSSNFTTSRFVQENHSFSRKGVLRGLHYQKGQAKLVRVISGSVLDIAVDFRPHSKTYKKVYSFELSGVNFRQVLIPDGFLHGFYALEDAHLVYKVSSYYNPKLEGGICPFDRELDIAWPEGEKNLSKKDQQWPSIKEFESVV